ncbi:polypeptide N-acetylgalactosaminyltransferase 13-like [Haliotis cracherodii]|uniref:polypeptide N-acetylgalactosaminyltransferase 13-like n=1 Tax=Haliotis cracherodii TaxID=6455 RepID=UPI0039EBCE41
MINTMRFRAKIYTLFLHVFLCGLFFNWILGSFKKKERAPDPNKGLDIQVQGWKNPGLNANGENGRGMTFVGTELKLAEQYMETFKVNVLASDLIGLNRSIPDTRFPSCGSLIYPVSQLPTTSVIIPFHNEWRSLLLRTVYSILTRTPPPLLQEIILVDDASSLDVLKKPLDQYIADHFQDGKVKVVRMPERGGLIKGRLRGWQEAKGDVLVFLDSHMEVQVDWLPPLLNEIRKNNKTLAMSVLDKVDARTLQYNVAEDNVMRYGFQWKLGFYGLGFRPEQLGEQRHSPRRGVSMVGAAYAVDKAYFAEIGAYDEGMQIWGGENIEMAWRVWMCGGQLLHVPCSHVGHIERPQPYTFPGGGRHETKLVNFKRAVEVWMGPYKRFVYRQFPEMETLDAGDLSSRLALKDRLKCRDFSWFLQHVWPELLVYDEDVRAWGKLKNDQTMTCLDNHKGLYPGRVFMEQCKEDLNTQGFSLMHDGRLRTTVLCVSTGTIKDRERPLLKECYNQHSIWKLHHETKWLSEEASGLCLDVFNGYPIMAPCVRNSTSQQWTFDHNK